MGFGGSYDLPVAAHARRGARRALRAAVTTSNAYYLDIVVQVYMWRRRPSPGTCSAVRGPVLPRHSAFFGIGRTPRACCSSRPASPRGSACWRGCAAALFALVIGYLAIRLRGPFFTSRPCPRRGAPDPGRLLPRPHRRLQGLSLPSPRAWPTSPSTASAPTRWPGSGSLFALLVSWLIDGRPRLLPGAIREEEEAARAVGVPSWGSS